MTPVAKVSPDILTAHLEGEAVLLHLGTKAYFKLNATAAAVWKGVEAGEDEEALVARLTREFTVDAAEARTELRRTIVDLRGRGALLP
ncbi:MAG: PqqD family protein [Gemmatimonadales bacterium]